MRDHRGNGKLERLIRTINERLRTNENIVLKRDKTAHSEILNALRMREKADGKSPFENLYSRKPKTVKSNIVDKFKGVSEADPSLKLSTSDFEDEIDSAIVVREMTKGSNLEGQFKEKSGKVIKETAHTITFLPKHSKKEVIYSKRVVAKTKSKRRNVEPRTEEQAAPSKRWEVMEDSSEGEPYVVSAETGDDEATTTDSHHDGERRIKDEEKVEEEKSRPEAVEAEREEMANP